MVHDILAKEWRKIDSRLGKVHEHTIMGSLNIAIVGDVGWYLGLVGNRALMVTKSARQRLRM